MKIARMLMGLAGVPFFIAAPLAAAATEEVTEPVSSTLDPLLWLPGDWSCAGHYLDLPPLAQAHPATAEFHVRVDAGGTWIAGRYREKKTAQNPAPVSLVDQISIDPVVGVGIRAAVDSHLGRIVATFTGYDGDVTTYAGSYLINGLAVPFSETLVRTGSGVFTTDSRVDLGAGPQTFQTLVCTRQ